MMEVEQQSEHLNAPEVLAALLDEFSAVTDYRTLRDSLPRHLAGLLKCRCVLLYQRIGETLQFASGTFDEKPGWSASLLAVAHINPIDLNGDTLEASAWRLRRAVTAPVESSTPSFVAVPLIYRHRAIGVLVAIRGEGEPRKTIQGAISWTQALTYWSSDELQVVEVVAGIVALLLENTRLLERDRARIHELSLLNSISSQMSCSMYERERLQSVVIQRTKEITAADLCELIEPSTPPGAIPWITPTLHELLLLRFSQHREESIVVERPGDSEYLNQLPANVKTFFAIPLLSSRALGRRSGQGHPYAVAPGLKVLGVVVGAYHRAWKLRREELVLLQVLASQASAMLENMHLVAEVIEARNEARKLLRQVLDDQRLKELILESMPGGLIAVDLQGCITTFNRAAEAILGYHPYEVLGQPLQKILDLQLPMDILEAAGSVHHEQESGMQGFPTTLVTVDRSGQEVMLDVHLLPLHNDHGEQIGALATFSDVTAMHRLEEEKRRLDRLASLGEMAASVAHEVRNPLASIKTCVQMLMDDLAGDGLSHVLPGGDQYIASVGGSAQESVSIVLKEVERLDSIVRNLLLFAKPRRLHRVPCNLIELSDHVLQIMQAQCAEAGVVVHRVYAPVPLVRVDVAQMEQVLFNLYMNALQAMPDGGVLTISCQTVAAENLKRESRNLIELSVSDTGVGIPPEQLERIFQPFFTTKAHGIGLGLPITRRLVEDHQGHILVESQLGYGATISVRLPLIEVGGPDSLGP